MSRSFLVASRSVFAACFFVPVASGQFATSVVQFTPGSNANASFPAAKALGGPQGGGSSSGSVDVCVLGVGGSLTLGFASAIVDGPGADLSCFENGFGFGGSGNFSEVAFVEVSSDGVNFARFPSNYGGPPSPQSAFGTLPFGTFSGLVGGLPVFTNVVSNTLDPRDPVVAGGEFFDLAELVADPLVVSGAVDLQAIQFVRIRDAVAGVDVDTSGKFVFDNGGATGSADIDAVAVCHDATIDLAHAPICDLRFDSQGFIEWTLGDPDGFFTLALLTITCSVDFQPVSFASVLPAFSIVAFDGKVATLRSLGPVTGSGILGVFAASVRDQAQALSGDQLLLQG